MKKITKILSLLIFVLMITSCKNEKSLQSYLVESQEKTGFSTIDLPVNSLLSIKTNVSNEVKETLKSVRKINVVFLQKTNENITTYEEEKIKLKKIFKNNKEYKSLGNLKAKGMHVNVYYSGETESIDEIIAFGYGNEAGVGVARLLGENMNPAKIIEMLNNVKIDDDNVSLDQFKNFFKR